MSFLGKVKVLEKYIVENDVFQLVVERPVDITEIKSGQFFNFSVPAVMLRRPISVSNFDSDSIEFTIKAIGEGTNTLMTLETGDEIDIMGPLGNGFEVAAHQRVLLIGGGIGIAPIKGLLEKWPHLETQMDCILGYRETPFLIELFQSRVQSLEVVSETDRRFRNGFVTEPLLEHLDAKTYDMIYACGPEAMLRQVARICNDAKIPVQLLMEEKMACGIGACLGCTCKVKSGDFGFEHVRMCKEGPMFYGSEVIFDV